MLTFKPAQIYFNLPRGDYLYESFNSSLTPFDSGTWRLHLFRQPGANTLRLEWCDVTKFVVIVSFKLATNICEADDVGHANLEPGSGFPPNTTGSIDIPLDGSGYLGWIRFELDVRPVVVVHAAAVPSAPIKSLSEEVKATARHSALTFSSYAPNDVVFYFPRSNRELWANSKTLKKASTYWKDMLDAGFSETNKNSNQAYTATLADLELTSYDSDDEADKVSHKLATSRINWTLPTGVKEVVIKEAAYTTYHAVLTWAHSGYIEFAKLTSGAIAIKPTSDQPKPKRPRHNPAPASPSADPTLPLPASPKSVYQLAHFLELPDLMQLALHSFKSQLDVENVLYQLTSEIVLHDEVKAAVFAFAKANWAAVKKSKALVELSTVEVMEALGGGFGARLVELMAQC